MGSFPYFPISDLYSVLVEVFQNYWNENNTHQTTCFWFLISIRLCIMQVLYISIHLSLNPHNQFLNTLIKKLVITFMWKTAFIFKNKDKIDLIFTNVFYLLVHLWFWFWCFITQDLVSSILIKFKSLWFPPLLLLLESCSLSEDQETTYATLWNFSGRQAPSNEMASS